MAQRIAAQLLWVFVLLAMWVLQHLFAARWAGLIGMLWIFLGQTPAIELRPRVVPARLAWLTSFLAGFVLMLAVIVLPFWLGLCLAVAWIPASVLIYGRVFQQRAKVDAWRVAKVTEWKTLVEAGVPEDVAAAQVNKQFDESYPGGLP